MLEANALVSRMASHPTHHPLIHPGNLLLLLLSPSNYLIANAGADSVL